jgi:tRNA A-37 threonylcarbamoyl transferase component Bud32
MVKCRICSKSYSSISSVRRHLKEIHGPKKICPFCFNYYGRLNAHLISCKRYLRYQFNKLKEIDGEIYFVDEAKRNHKSQTLQKITIKVNNLNNAKRIKRTNYFIFPDMKIGEGSYCDVYYGINYNSKKEFAIKLFKDTHKNIENFLLEKKMLKALKNAPIFPMLFYSLHENLIIIQSLLGPNLKKLFEYCGKKFSLQTICFIGIEIISRLKTFHSLGFIHRDIKPSNMAWGNLSESTNELKDQIMLIDYDLSGIFREKKNSHINFQYDDIIVGNSTFKSLNSSNYISQTRRETLPIKGTSLGTD